MPIAPGTPRVDCPMSESTRETLIFSSNSPFTKYLAKQVFPVSLAPSKTVIPLFSLKAWRIVSHSGSAIISKVSPPLFSLLRYHKCAASKMGLFSDVDN